MTAIPTTGSIYSAYVTQRLADGTTSQGSRRVLILDVTEDATRSPQSESLGAASVLAGQPLRTVVWQSIGGEDDPTHAGIPTGEPQRVELHRDWGLGGDTDATSITLLGQVGTYEARDPKSNSVEILRDYALRRLDVLAR